MALAGKHALVTGGGRGIGRAIAAALAGAGAIVTVVGRSEAPLRATVAAGEAAGCAVADVTDAVEVRRQVTAAEAARGPIAILVNNAGSVETGAFVKTDPSVFQAMWDVHVMGAVYASQAVLPGMIERGFGRIVNVASTSGLQGLPLCQRLLRGEARACGSDARARRRDRDARGDGQCGMSRLYRYRPRARQHRAGRRHDRPRAPMCSPPTRRTRRSAA